MALKLLFASVFSILLQKSRIMLTRI